MDPSSLRTTLERALRRADQYVWFYSEQMDWNAPGEVTTEWVDAVSGARAAAAEPPTTPPPVVSITGPDHRAIFSKGTPVVLTAAASSVDRRIEKVEFFKGTTKLGESASAPFSYSWINPPTGTHRITAQATDDHGATSVSSPIRVTITTKFAVRINFQAAAVTRAIGFRPDVGDPFGPREGLTYGWNASHRTNARHRGASNVDLHLDTLCQMQSGGKWEIAVPNGSYAVTVGVGDSQYPSTYTLNVEGVSFWTAQSLAPAHFLRKTRIVKVSDGKLTLDQGNAAFEATRINYVTITGRKPTAIP
jgi:hypothetical protein